MKYILCLLMFNLVFNILQGLEKTTLINKNFFSDIVGMTEEEFRTKFAWKRGESIRFSSLAQADWINEFLRRAAIFYNQPYTKIVSASTKTFGEIYVNTGVSVGEYDGLLAGKEPLTKASLFLIQFYDPSRAQESDIRWLQANSELKDVVFQIASNFNTLEGGMGNKNALLTEMLQAPTQGELASISAAGGTIYRKYFLDLFNLLYRLKGIEMDESDGFANPTDLTLQNISNGSVKLTIENYKDVAVCMHDVVVTSGSGGISPDDAVVRLPVILEGTGIDSYKTQTVQQVFTAALDTYTLRSGKSRDGSRVPILWNKNIEDFCKMIIKASYEGTLKAACYAGQPKVVLTLMGGGSFRNDIAWIADALEGLEDFIKQRGMQVVLMYRPDKPRDVPVRTIEGDIVFLQRMVVLANRINNTKYNLDSLLQSYVTNAYTNKPYTKEAQELQKKFPNNFYGPTALVQPSTTAPVSTEVLKNALSSFTKTLHAVDAILKKSKPLEKIESLTNVVQIDDTTYKVGNKTIKLVAGDITAQKGIDALVTAANVGNIATVAGGGIAGAIYKKMGKENELKIFAEDIKNRYKLHVGKIGEAYIGTLEKGSLLNKLGYAYLVSAVGPDCRAGEDVNLVANAYRNTLQEAAKLNVKSIVIPRISAIIFGCPAATINKFAVDTVVDYLAKNPNSSIDTVYLIFYPGQPLDMQALENYKKLLHDQTSKKN